jgi:hypothetical protein
MFLGEKELITDSDRTSLLGLRISGSPLGSRLKYFPHRGESGFWGE